MSQPEKTPKSFQLHTGKTSIKQIGLIILAALFFIGLVWLGGWGVNREIDSDKQESVSLVGKTEFEETFNIPYVTKDQGENLGQKKLSEEIPHYEQTEKIESYTLKYPNSAKIQDVYRFYSSKSMDENLAYYTDWAKKNEWDEANVVKEDNLFSLYLTKSKEMLVVKISKEEDKVNVNLDLVKERDQ